MTKKFSDVNDLLETALFLMEQGQDRRAYQYVQAVWKNTRFGEEVPKAVLDDMANLKTDAILYLVSKSVGIPREDI